MYFSRLGFFSRSLVGTSLWNARYFCWLFLALVSSLAMAAPDQRPVVRVSLIKTGTVNTLEGFVFSGGSYFRTIALVHSAVLVEHPKGRFLFDTGLGEGIDDQFAAEMPWWGRLIFGYHKETSVLGQLNAAKVPLPDFIVMSHAHWDHGSGLPDFPSTPVRMLSAEAEFLSQNHPAAVFKRQFSGLAGRLKLLVLERRKLGIYPESLDLFGDGTIQLVPMSGHTPGAIGMIVRLRSGRSLFFVGDTVWSARALAEASPKFWLTSRILDHDRDTTLRAVSQLRNFSREMPNVIVVPAHDAEVQDALGYFPQWIE